ncbi:MAG: hypothetical protein E6J76_03355 [Deltaproteobacteria bacterium]|nr:MAG: hypothetical protein E6J76_03355 [Deltaproteobacteria bacterium]
MAGRRLMKNPNDIRMRTVGGCARAVRGAISLAIVAGLALGLIAREVRAAATTPTLILTTAAPAVVGGARAVAFEGRFDFPNALEVGYPLELVIFQGAHFVRYPIAGTAHVGDSAALLAGHLDEDDVPTFDLEGAEAPADVRIVTFVPDRLRVTLPATFTAGRVTAVLFASVPHGAVVSNPIVFLLP